MPFTYYVATKDSKVWQINNVTAITVASPLVSNGTYRDNPPVVVGGAAGALGASASASVAGGVSPTVNTTAGVSAEAIGESSVVEDDAYAHVAPRFLNSPIGMVFFTTTAGIATAPTSSTFTTTPPSTDFYVVECDCNFMLDEVIGWFNAPPVGLTPQRSIVTAYNEP